MKPVLELVVPAVKPKIGLKYRIITIKWVTLKKLVLARRLP